MRLLIDICFTELSVLEPIWNLGDLQHGCYLHQCICPWIGGRVMVWEMGEHYTYAHLI